MNYEARIQFFLPLEPSTSPLSRQIVEDARARRIEPEWEKMISETEIAMAEEVTKFLAKHNLVDVLELFQEQWLDYTSRHNAACDETVSDSVAAATAAVASATVSQSPVKEAAKGVVVVSSSKKYGITSVLGDEKDLWDCDELADVAPSYPAGGGLNVADFEEAKKFPVQMVPYHPYQKVAPPTNLPLESFDLRIIYEAGRTGFEEAKEFPIVVNSVIAGRYQVLQFLDSAAFSRAVKCLDLKHGHEVCVKVIRNSKDFYDQALDEIKLLQYINCGGDPDENCVLQLFDYFYYKEHVFIVTELLRDNLYEFGKFNREQETEPYFTLPRVQSIARQVLKALTYLHKLNLLHCDLKPENILIKSYSRCEVKVIDFGSSCFTTDNLSSYIQSRCYRAPEVILGCHYNGGIDVWSLGAILPELMTGNVMFHNETVPGMLARIAGVCGPFPARMLHEGRHTCRFLTQHGAFYEVKKETDQLVFHFPTVTPLRSTNLGSDDELYVDFIEKCLTVDHTLRPSAAEMLLHPFLKKDYGNVFSSPPALKAAAVTSPK